MTKIVINTGTGFDLTHKAVMRYAELKGIKLTAYKYNHDKNLHEKCEDPDSLPDMFEGFIVYFINTVAEIIPYEHNPKLFFSIYNIDRTDPALIQAVEELKDSEHLDLKIVEIPDDVKWEIHEDEMGPECVKEVSRCWS